MTLNRLRRRLRNLHELDRFFDKPENRVFAVEYLKDKDEKRAYKRTKEYMKRKRKRKDQV